MDKDFKIFLAHILESIDLVEGYIKGVNKGKFMRSIAVQDMVIRRLEIIGEAVRNLPLEFKEENSDIPWKNISGMRDFLIHEYFGVDNELVWNTVKKYLPQLKKNILRILEKE